MPYFQVPFFAMFYDTEVFGGKPKILNRLVLIIRDMLE